MMEQAAESGEKILMEAIAVDIVLVAYPLGAYPAQAFDFIDVLGRGTTMMADEQIPFVPLENIGVTRLALPWSTAKVIKVRENAFHVSLSEPMDHRYLVVLRRYAQG